MAAVVAALAAAGGGRPVDHQAVEAALVALEGCAALEAWRLTAEMAGACGVERWRADAERRAAVVARHAGDRAEVFQRWVTARLELR
jgi:hypothetical protein